MHRLDNDVNLANSLVAIRTATATGAIKWKRLLHPISGELLAYRGIGEDLDLGSDDETAYVYMLDDEFLSSDDPDIEDGPSISRYASVDDKHFDAMVLAKFSDIIVQENLAKLIRLVRQVAD